METEGKIIKNAEFKRRFVNPDGTHEDLTYLDIENQVENEVRKRLGMSVSDVYKFETDIDYLFQYFDIDEEIRTNRSSEEIYLIDGSVFERRQEIESVHGCFGNNYSIIVFEGIEGEETGRQYQAKIEGTIISVEREL